jgi:riboflavin synthase
VFTGIIEAKSKILEVTPGQDSLQIVVQRPQNFDDIKIGDSICCNGVCLTVETFNPETMTFTIGFETLKITGWTEERLKNSTLNLERSLRFGDRIHGHLVSGHVDTRSKLKKKEWAGDCLLLNVEVPEKRASEIWEKSSVAINGVSLTVNWIENNEFQVCLVPETLRKTNLDELTQGEPVNIETDYYMKGLLKSQGVKDA